MPVKSTNLIYVHCSYPGGTGLSDIRIGFVDSTDIIIIIDQALLDYY